MMAKKTTTGNSLVDAYIRELELALTGCDPRERAETIVAVQSHLDQALSADASDGETKRVLLELGSPADIAGAMTPAPQMETNGRKPSDPFALTALVTSILSMVILIPFFYFAIPLALGTLVAAGFHLKAAQANKPLTRAAIVVSALVLAVALVVGLTLVAVGDPIADMPAPAVPLEP
ncbi:hypothetical protein GCM10022381_22910 [Leifsonia kafniensis]|uniref:DUF1700 domain-containing protein n=1 Tax=Leifsonia kafniensis TaxID=475957 RepID=A0ABP7KKI6_9MICO